MGDTLDAVDPHTVGGVLLSANIKPIMMCESCHVFRGVLAVGEKTNGNVAGILKAAQQGDQDAAARLLPHMYDELRKLAWAEMARLAPRETIQPTALVHEEAGQIAHLDHDPTNNKLENLCFVCQPHHGQYDSKTS